MPATLARMAERPRWKDLPESVCTARAGSSEHSVTDRRHLTTARLRLDAPTPSDVDELHAIYTDPRVWEHFPSLRFTDADQTRAMLQAWGEAWESDGLGPWIVRNAAGGAILGHGGCQLRRDTFWNLGYRFAPEAQGSGFASEVAACALAAAQEARPDVPVIAYLLEHNPASRRVAEKTGLTLRHRAWDKGNPDPEAMRLVFADRELNATELDAALQ